MTPPHHRFRHLVDAGAAHVTLGMGRTIHVRHPTLRHHTICGMGPAPYYDARRGIIEPVPEDDYRPDGPGMMRQTEAPVTCHRCMGIDPAA